MKNKSKPPKRTQGMKWIRSDKRLAIYLRDGLACCYCGASVEEATRLTLDHLRPYSLGGGNKENNLVTCCLRCNSVRGNRPWRKFVEHVAAYLDCDVDAAEIRRHIINTRNRKLDRDAAKEMIERRGGFVAALKEKNHVE